MQYKKIENLKYYYKNTVLIVSKRINYIELNPTILRYRHINILYIVYNKLCTAERIRAFVPTNNYIYFFNNNYDSLMS